MTIEIRELNHAAIYVRDLAKSMHFYGEILGLPLLPRPAFDFPGAWYAFATQELHLIEDPNLLEADRHHHHFALRVDDTYEARRELEAKGVDSFVSHGFRPDGVVQLFLRDPDGYHIELYSFAPVHGSSPE